MRHPRLTFTRLGSTLLGPVVAVLCLFSVAACGVTDGSPTGAGTEVNLHELPPGQVVFQVSWSRGLMLATSTFPARPALTIYANGEAYLAKEDNGSYWPGKPVTFKRGQVPDSELHALVRKALASGLFDGADFGDPQVTDIGPTTVSLRPGSAPTKQVHTLALNMPDVDDAVSASQADNREALRSLAARFTDAVSVHGGTWEPRRIDITEHRGNGDDEPADPWPGPDLDRILTTQTAWGRCGVVQGSTAAKLYSAALEHGSVDWTVDGARTQLIVRALLPGEPGCRI